MDHPSPDSLPPGINHGLVPPGTGKRRLVIRDLIAQHRKALIITVHLFMPGIRDDLRLSGVKGFVYDVHAKPDQHAVVLEAFERLDSGALVTSMSAAAKLRFNGPLLLFAECTVGMRSRQFLDILRQSSTRQVHYVNCHFGTEAVSTREILGIQSVSQTLTKVPH
jgi:hypothetical protein